MGSRTRVGEPRSWSIQPNQLSLVYSGTITNLPVTNGCTRVDACVTTLRDRHLNANRIRYGLHTVAGTCSAPNPGRSYDGLHFKGID